MPDDAEIMRNARAANTLLQACGESYLKAAQDGRLKEWAEMCHAVIAMLSGHGK